MIFYKFYRAIAAQIPAYQDLENVSFSGNLRSTVLMKAKRYHRKLHWYYVEQFLEVLHLLIVLTTLFLKLRYTHREFCSSL